MSHSVPRCYQRFLLSTHTGRRRLKFPRQGLKEGFAKITVCSSIYTDTVSKRVHGMSKQEEKTRLEERSTFGLSFGLPTLEMKGWAGVV